MFGNLNNFPAPTGCYGVGTTELHLIDTKRKEPNNPNSPRELMLHIWYPTNIKTENFVYIITSNMVITRKDY